MSVRYSIRSGSVFPRINETFTKIIIAAIRSAEYIEHLMNTDAHINVCPEVPTC